MKLLQTSIYFFVSYLTLNALSANVLAQSYSTNRTWQVSQKFQPSIDQKSNPTTIGAATRFKPPLDDTANPETVGAATRGSSCLNKKVITPLLPQSNSGLTVTENPTFFWQIPPSSTKTAEFVLLTNNKEDIDNQRVVYQTTITLSEQPGIVSFTLPKQAANLETNSSYRWYLTLICDPEDSSQNTFVEGLVKRIPAKSPLSELPETTNLLQKASTYAQAGIWHDALTSLIKLRCQKPNDPTIKAHWQQFLDSVELNELESEPIVNFCMNQNEY